MKSTITDDQGSILATGYAQEKESSSYINKTSFIENCETSAVGRALGFAGIGIDGSMASADELANALNNQGVKKIGKKEQTILENMCKKKGLDPKEVFPGGLDLTDEQYTAAVDRGSYGNFIHDSAGYGLYQATYWSIKEHRLKYAHMHRRRYVTSIGCCTGNCSFTVCDAGNLSR